MADGTTFADENRPRLRKTAPWHRVNVPHDEPKYDAKWSADDPKKGCAVNKIKELWKTVKVKIKKVEEPSFALRFLIHCVEGMHMPMHVGNNHDRGGTTRRSGSSTGAQTCARSGMVV